MKEQPKISIIMPVYNTEEFIDGSIKSVIDQKYDNLELICVNDNTPDHAIDICRTYQTQYPDIIRILDAETDAAGNPINRGLENTRNRGMHAATGDYIMFLDSDDTLKYGSLSALAEIAKNGDNDIIFFSYSRIVDGTEYPVTVGEIQDGAYTIKHFCGLLLDGINLGVLSCVGSKMYKREFLQKNELLFDSRYRHNEDIGFILTALCKAESVFFLNMPLYHYLIRTSGSIMSSHKKDMFSTTVKARELIKTLFVTHGYWDNKDYQYRYYKELLGLINGCLLNEIKYGSNDSYKREFKTIYSYEEFQTMISCLQDRAKPFSQQGLYVYCLQRGFSRVCKLFLEAKNWRKLKRITMR